MSRATTIIVGAGQAGANAAIAMREAGYPGHILLLGDEAHAPYERPPLSKAALTGEAQPTVTHFHPQPRYAERDITLLLGVAAVALDPAMGRLHMADGRALAFDQLLLATGGRARRLTGHGSARALSLRTLDDAHALRRQMLGSRPLVCIGAGVIGLEVASSARARGGAVTVIEAAARVMGRAATEHIADRLTRLHRDHGVRLLLGTAVAAIEDAHVACADGTLIAADTVVAGIGMDRNLALAEQAGLEIDAGIVVDAWGATSAPGIFAAGDVAAFWHPRLARRLRLESWRHAQNHGIAVGRVMAGGREPYDEVPWFWTDQHGVNLQVAGLPDDAMTAVFRGDPEGDSFSVFHLDADGRMLGATGWNAPRDVRAGTMLIGAGRPVEPATLRDALANLQSYAKQVAR